MAEDDGWETQLRWHGAERVHIPTLAKDATLRDLFAAYALTGLLATNDEKPFFKAMGELQAHYAELSYGHADAMLAARNKNTSGESR